MEVMLLLLLYHDAYHHGFNSVLNEVPLPFKITSKSVQHNAHVLRETLSEWATRRTPLGTLEEWKRAASATFVPESLEGTCLWLDSTEYQKKKRRMEQTDPQYSHKLKLPGRRYILFADGQNRADPCGAASPPSDMTVTLYIS